jgi:hypothetical protein
MNDHQSFFHPDLAQVHSLAQWKCDTAQSAGHEVIGHGEVKIDPRQPR